MKKIKVQFDVISGVYAVEEFDQDIIMVEENSLSEFLRQWREGTGGAEINEDTYNMIDQEYGIR